MEKVCKRKIKSPFDQVVPNEWSVVGSDLFHPGRTYEKSSGRKKLKMESSLHTNSSEVTKWSSFINHFFPESNRNDIDPALHISQTDSPPPKLQPSPEKCLVSGLKPAAPKSLSKGWIYSIYSSGVANVSSIPSPAKNSTNDKSKLCTSARSIQLSKNKVQNSRNLPKRSGCSRELFQDITFSILPNKDPASYEPSISPCVSPQKVPNSPGISPALTSLSNSNRNVSDRPKCKTNSEKVIKEDCIIISPVKSPCKSNSKLTTKLTQTVISQNCSFIYPFKSQFHSNSDFNIVPTLKSQPTSNSECNPKFSVMQKNTTRDSNTVSTVQSPCYINSICGPESSVKKSKQTTVSPLIFGENCFKQENSVSKERDSVDPQCTPQPVKKRNSGASWIGGILWQPKRVDELSDLQHQWNSVATPTHLVHIDELVSPVKSSDSRGTSWIGGISWQPKTPKKSPGSVETPDSAKKRKYFVSGGFAQQLKKLEQREQASINLERHKTSSKVMPHRQVLVTAMDLSISALPLAYCRDQSTQEDIILVLPANQVSSVQVSSTLKVSTLGQRAVISSGLTIICAPGDIEVVKMEKQPKVPQLLFTWKCPCRSGMDFNSSTCTANSVL